jgi:hypothetical protein
MKMHTTIFRSERTNDCLRLVDPVSHLDLQCLFLPYVHLSLLEHVARLERCHRHLESRKHVVLASSNDGEASEPQNGNTCQARPLVCPYIGISGVGHARVASVGRKRHVYASCGRLIGRQIRARRFHYFSSSSNTAIRYPMSHQNT